MKRILCLCCAVILILSGCSAASNDGQKPPQPTVHTKSQATGVSLDTARLAKTTAEQDKRVDAATAVAIERDLSVALKVSNFNRLQLKNIRQTVHQNLRDQFPAYTVYVTTDSKVFSDLEKLQQDMRQNRPPKPPQEQKYKKKLQQLIQDMKG